MDIYIDCLGLICPIPVVKAKIQYKKINPGDSITILTDHSCTYSNLKDLFKKSNCEIKVKESSGIWEIIIKKNL